MELESEFLAASDEVKLGVLWKAATGAMGQGDDDPAIAARKGMTILDWLSDPDLEDENGLTLGMDVNTMSDLYGHFEELESAWSIIETSGEELHRLIPSSVTA